MQRSVPDNADEIMNNTYPSCVAVIGLGYAGLPLDVAFGRCIRTIRYDLDSHRISELKNGQDRDSQFSAEDLGVPHLEFSNKPTDLRQAPLILVVVPTPIDQHKRPDLGPLIDASRTVGRNLSPGTTVVYESTVYPGVTEEVCLPILERESGMCGGKDFGIGYSPERINPGDGAHSLAQVVKVVAAQDMETARFLAGTYSLVAKSGIHIAPDIRTAEAAKVIENVQRDLNIALMNELSILFHKLDMDTRAVLEAAGTKWNFLPFEPGLVGGHCIPVDPYYLTFKAEGAGYHPEVILAGRRVNDSMGAFIAQESVKLLVKAGKALGKSRAVVLGLTFKEDVPDVRNSGVIGLVKELESYGVTVDVYDPLLDRAKSRAILGMNLIADPFNGQQKYDGIVLAVPHEEFRTKDWKSFRDLLTDGPEGILIDVKGILREAAKCCDKNKIVYWSL